MEAWWGFLQGGGWQFYSDHLFRGDIGRCQAEEWGNQLQSFEDLPDTFGERTVRDWKATVSGQQRDDCDFEQVVGSTGKRKSMCILELWYLVFNVGYIRKEKIPKSSQIWGDCGIIC